MSGTRALNSQGPGPARDPAMIARGHAEYKAWLPDVGRCFSPLTCSKQQHVVGDWRSWTVEGIYQGLKRIRVFDLSLVAGQMGAQVIESDRTGHVVHLPSIMQVNENLIQHPLFHALKSGKRYNSKRNRYFGLLPTGERNWEFTYTWLHPETGAAIMRDEFSTLVSDPAMRAHLTQFPEEVAGLRAAWANGEHLITDAMRQAHGHLRLVADFVSHEDPI